MSEKNNASLDKEQEQTSPAIEDVIRELADGNLRQTALGFATYLEEKGMTPCLWFNRNYWRVPYEGNYLCGMLVNKDEWRVWFFSGDYSGEFEQGFIKTVQDNVTHCVSCHTRDICPQGKDVTVFGKEFTSACFQFPVQFVNPNDSTLECIKELIEYWKEVAPHSDSWHAH